jgi:hypothetical protein
MLCLKRIYFCPRGDETNKIKMYTKTRQNDDDMNLCVFVCESMDIMPFFHSFTAADAAAASFIVSLLTMFISTTSNLFSFLWFYYFSFLLSLSTIFFSHSA